MAYMSSMTAALDRIWECDYIALFFIWISMLNDFNTEGTYLISRLSTVEVIDHWGIIQAVTRGAFLSNVNRIIPVSICK